MLIAICIVSFRNPNEIADCVAALALSTYTDYEIVICENGGSDAYNRLVNAVPVVLPCGQAVTCIEAPGNVGYAGGINICMNARPDAGAWWIVNPDTVPEADTLAALKLRLGNGDCDAVGGIIYRTDGKVQAYGGRWRPWLARAESIGYGAELSSVPDSAVIEAQLNYLLGCCMLIGRSFVARVGLMREDYFLYCEEVEWCLRAVRHGLRLGFAPDARILHVQGGTTGSANLITLRPRLPIYMDERNKLHVVKDTTPLCFPLAAATSLVLAILRYARRGAFRQFGYALSGWTAGIMGRRGLPPWIR